MNRSIRTSRLTSAGLISGVVLVLSGCAGAPGSQMDSHVVLKDPIQEAECASLRYDGICVSRGNPIGGVQIDDTRSGVLKVTNKADEPFDAIVYIHTETIQRETNTTGKILDHSGKFMKVGYLQPGESKEIEYEISIPDVSDSLINAEPLEASVNYYIIEAGNADRFDIPGEYP